jgi:hypothetical protein
LLEFDDIGGLKSGLCRLGRRSCRRCVPGQRFLRNGPVLDPEVFGFLMRGHGGLPIGYRPYTYRSLYQIHTPIPITESKNTEAYRM